MAPWRQNIADRQPCRRRGTPPGHEDEDRGQGRIEEGREGVDDPDQALDRAPPGPDG